MCGEAANRRQARKSAEGYIYTLRVIYKNLKEAGKRGIVTLNRLLKPRKNAGKRGVVRLS